MTYGLNDVANAYDKKFSGDGFRNSVSYYRWALKILAPQPNATLLDIACGMGDMLYYATEMGLVCSGIDLSPVAVDTARKKAPRANINEGNAENLQFPEESFNYVTILGSLEHLLDPGKGLIEMRRVLKWGGRALILVPNAYYLPDLVWQVGHRGLGPNHKQVVERFAAINEWRAFIESGGLQVKGVWRYDHQFPRCKDDWLWYKQNPRRLLKLAFRPFIPKNFAHSFLYLCTKDTSSKDRIFSPPVWPIPPRLVDLA